MFIGDPSSFENLFVSEVVVIERVSVYLAIFCYF